MQVMSLRVAIAVTVTVVSGLHVLALQASAAY